VFPGGSISLSLTATGGRGGGGLWPRRAGEARAGSTWRRRVTTDGAAQVVARRAPTLAKRATVGLALVSSLCMSEVTTPSPGCIAASASLGPAGLHPAIVSCRSSDLVLLLDSLVQEGRVVAFYYCAEVSDWMPQETGLTSDETVSAMAWPIPGRCGYGAPLGGLQFWPRTDR
jgi:hypothetical protein